MRNSMESPQKIKTRTSFDLGIPFLGIYLRESKALIWMDTCSPTFIAAVFTIAKTWKQPKCSLMDECVEKVWCACTHTHTHTFFTHRKGNPAIHDNMDGPWGHYAKWNNSDKDIWFTYMNSLMIHLWITNDSLICGFLKQISFLELIS